jgi:hypothetical protein
MDINKVPSLPDQTSARSEMKPLPWVAGCDNMLLGQGYRTPRGAVVGEYEQWFELRLTVENRRTISCTNLTSHPGLKPVSAMRSQRLSALAMARSTLC